jgi:hypothetical protein
LNRAERAREVGTISSSSERIRGETSVISARIAYKSRRFGARSR